MGHVGVFDRDVAAGDPRPLHDAVDVHPAQRVVVVRHRRDALALAVDLGIHDQQILAPVADRDRTGFMTRAFLIVTLSADTVIVPATRSASITAPGVVMVSEPEARRTVPAGTPVVAADG